MSGGEIVAAKAAAKAAKKALSEDQVVKDKLLAQAENTPAMKAAAESYATRIAIKQGLLTKAYSVLARMVGVRREYFEEGAFAADMAEKVADIPDEYLITPLASVALPAMQGLGYTLDEPPLKEMYLSLLATATDNRTAEQAHPSFAEIIRQLSGDEAQTLALALANPSIIAIVRISRKEPTTGGASRIINHLVNAIDQDTRKMSVNPQRSMWIDNWIRLGLIEVDYFYSVALPGAYDWVTERPEYLALTADSLGPDSLEVVNGLMRRTDFGIHFHRAVIAGT